MAIVSRLCLNIDSSLILKFQDGPQEEVNGCKGEREARHTTHPKISAFGGVTSLFATNFSQIRAMTEQAIGIGKKTARISVKPLRKRFSQRIIARGGPSRPKPKKVEVIDLVSDDEAEEEGAEAAMEQPPLVANREEPEEEEEDPEYEEEEEEEDPEESVEPHEIHSSWSPLSPFPATLELGKGEYDDHHNWNYDGDLDQWGTDVVGGEPAAAQSHDSVDGSKGSWFTPSTSTD
ncbi:hypothetical protein PIB30_032428 [Stylosanthes scabra]|uniref:Uncharacterized protein n=1 Tax=Stylosanthes scabra TaxID=79078 RepID=A0ABU6Z8Z6_9FABA|nr:hypothetical protein [Stylosanthes scabra]